MMYYGFIFSLFVVVVAFVIIMWRIIYLDHKDRKTLFKEVCKGIRKRKKTIDLREEER